MFPRDVRDKVVQYPGRYQLTNAVTGQGLGTFDLVAVPGTITEPGTPINKGYLQPIEDTLLELQLLNANYIGKSISLDWTEAKLVNWQKFWSAPGYTGNLLKQIDYTWNADKFCEAEVYKFFDYDGNGTLTQTRQFNVTYTWNEDKLCTGISIEEVQE